MMKQLPILFIAIILIFGCNKIPNKSILEKLNKEELFAAIKEDTLFSDFYKHVRYQADNLSDIKQVKYGDITYHRLFKYNKYINDTAYWNPLIKEYEKEWNDNYGIYSTQADSILNYWKKFIEENSLDKYLKIELVNINKEYYHYIGGIKNIDLGFRLTPLQGAIDQVLFSYGYQAKIYGDVPYSEKHFCNSTKPFASAITKYWKANYSEEKLFSDYTVETFLRDYNLYIEITDIRKDGINITFDDSAIPKLVSNCLKYEDKYPALFELTKDGLIKELVNKNYIERWIYKSKKMNEIKEKKDKLCFDFLNEA